MLGSGTAVPGCPSTRGTFYTGRPRNEGYTVILYILNELFVFLLHGGACYARVRNCVLTVKVYAVVYYLE